MGDSNCATRMREAMKAAIDFINEKQSATISVNISPECEEDWDADHAIIYLDVEALEEYVDIDGFRGDLIKVMSKTLGSKFTRRYNYESKAQKIGQLYYVDHGGEFEIYRYKKAKKGKTK